MRPCNATPWLDSNNRISHTYENNFNIRNFKTGTKLLPECMHVYHLYILHIKYLEMNIYKMYKQ